MDRDNYSDGSSDEVFSDESESSQEACSSAAYGDECPASSTTWVCLASASWA